MIGTAGQTAGAQTQAESLSASFRKAAERVRSTLVSVRPADGFVSWPQASAPALGMPAPFSPVPRRRVRNPDLAALAAGSGIVVDAERGCILTLDHLLEGVSQATVVLGDGRERNTSQIRRDPQSDLAILVIDPKGLNLTAAHWGDSRSLQAGDWVLTIGQPPGSDPAKSAGLFSARRFGAGTAPASELLETDAAVNAANSGGPLVNLSGEVMGVNLFIPAQRGPTGMGFAIPGERARRIASDLVEIGRVRRSYLGIQIEPGSRVAVDRGLPSGTVAVGSVTPGSPAASSGLRAGDLIVTIDGRPVVGIEMLQSKVELAPPGDELTLGIERENRRQDIKVRPGAVPDQAGPGTESPAPPATRRDALRARPRTAPRAAPRQSVPVKPRPSDLESAPPPDPVPPAQRPVEGPAADRSNGAPK